MSRGTDHRERSLDAIDRRILNELRRDGRLTAAELGHRVGLSSSPCWARVKRLEESGIIEGYAALVNQTKVGLPDTILIEVSLMHHDEDLLSRFGEALAGMPEVLEAYLVTGDYDYLIKVAVDGTSGYERFLRERLYRIPGIRQSRSLFALRCLKREVSVAV
ncbi:Lrp/AsnC family transcriptional regulator [Enterovirga rhinocerotis]|uniref:AsnC family transcriptional regulator n=1 Tax=Enterovirga rhinocerotis TaxID=1339210 RepID=A0A4R7C3H9_9HYPH|nr:Lrp/AsnC family transcriptional regulator [Enterovirga rhinocerotis]TDR93040.1 AsnC family transcriptional regulator [Enterovirga rhinocerotis]